MLKPNPPRSNILIAGLSAVGLGFLIWASTFSASYEICEAERHETHPKQTGFFPEIPYFVVCEGVAAGDNAELITAFATIIMAIFTGTLWLTSRIQARELKHSVDAAVAVDLPVIFLHDIDLITPDPIDGGPLSARQIQGVPPRLCRVFLEFKNYGRSPARVRQIFCDHLIVKKLPPEPMYRSGADVRTGTVIEDHGESWRPPALYTISFSEEQIDAIAKDKAFLWVYGFVSFQDFIGNNHDMRFCFRWFGVDAGVTSDTPNGFIEDGPEAYRRST